MKQIIFLSTLLLFGGVALPKAQAITNMEELWSSSGEEQSIAIYGFTTASAGDVNGDGYSDVIVAAQSYDTNNIDAGKAYLYLGSNTGLSTTSSWTSSGDDQASANYGTRVASAGDVNGDGYSDVIVGAEGYNGHVGKAYVYYGDATGLWATANWTTSGDDQSNSFLGFSVASAGDVNGDGYDDIVVGAYKYDTTNIDAGKAYLYLGGASGVSTTPTWTSSGDDQAEAWYGRRVMTAGDVNGDGYNDILIGADTYDASGSNTGKVYLYLGNAAGLSSAPAWTSSGDDQAGARFGMSVWGDDINNDGYADVIIGAHQYTTANSQAGKAYLYLGGASGVSTTPTWTSSGDDQAEAWYGFSTPSVGDVNGDNYKDVVIGAMRYDNSIDENAGKIYLYLGNANGLNNLAEWTIEGDSAETDPLGERFGISTAGAGDVNGDGYDEFIAGAEGYNNSAGRAWVFGNQAEFPLSINAGAESTDSPNVTLTLSATSDDTPSQVIFSEDSGFANTSWESYIASKSFTLSSTEGLKTVYAKFKDANDNQSITVSDSIVYNATEEILDYTPSKVRDVRVPKKYRQAKQVRVIWQKRVHATGYIIRLCKYKEQIKKYTKIRTVKIETNKGRKTIKKLKPITNYKVQVRAKRIINNTVYKGKWSTAVKFKTKFMIITI